MADLIINFVLDIVAVIAVASFGGVLCFVFLSWVKMVIDELRGE